MRSNRSPILTILLLIFFLRFDLSNALYGASSPVLQLTPSNFKSKVCFQSPFCLFIQFHCIYRSCFYFFNCFLISLQWRNRIRWYLCGALFFVSFIVIGMCFCEFRKYLGSFSIVITFRFKTISLFYALIEIFLILHLSGTSLKPDVNFICAT